MAALVLGSGALVRLLFAGLVPVFPDEAYYWEWSRRLAAGYYDHPPAIPLLIRGGTSLVGTSAIGVRVLSVLAGLVAGVATTAVAWRLAGASAARRAAVIITCLPLAAAGLVLATPDAPLLATTALAVYGIVRAIQAPPRSRQALAFWSAAGIALGLAFCSKYTSILLPLGVAIAVIARKRLRGRLAEPGPYVACVLAIVVFLPVLLWNARHDWLSFAFQLRHGLAAPAAPTRPDPLAPLKRLGDLIGGQAGLVSPILFVLMLIATARGLARRASDASFVLAVVATFSFILFCYSATRQRVEANWPAPAYIPAIALLAASDWSPGMRRWFSAGVGLAAVLTLVIYLHAAFGILPLAPPRDPVARAAGWRELSERSIALQRQARPSAGGRTWLGADRYQDAAELAFHSPGHPLVFSLNLSGRGNQYDLWPGFADTARPGDALVLALDESAERPGSVVRLAPYFAAATPSELVELRNRRGVVTRRRLWLMTGWRGGWPSAALMVTGASGPLGRAAGF